MCNSLYIVHRTVAIVHCTSHSYIVRYALLIFVWIIFLIFVWIIIDVS